MVKYKYNYILRIINLFEKFTEKAIDVVKAAQIYAIEFNHEKIYPEHLLLALLNDTNSIIVKTFSIRKIEINGVIDVTFIYFL